MRRAASFALIYHLVESESRVHLAVVLGVGVEEITPQRLFELSRTLLWEGFKPSRGSE